MNQLMEMEQAIAEFRPTPMTQPRASAIWPLVWLAAPVLSGVLLWMSFFPLNWGWLGWVALVPLTFAVRCQARARRIYLGAFAGGSLFFWTSLQWMRVADLSMYGSWALLSVYCSLYFPVAVLLLRALDRHTRLPLTLSVPLVWTALEFVRSFLLTGVAWYFLGHTQHAFLSMIQVADLAGVYAITFLLGMSNGLIADALLLIPFLRQRLQVTSRPSSKWVLASLAVLTAALAGGDYAYGQWRLSQQDFQPGPRVALLQANLDQRTRSDVWEKLKVLGGGDKNKGVFKYYADLCWRAVTYSPRPDIIVWPETSFPDVWNELPRDLNKVDKSVMDWSELTRLRLTEFSQVFKSHHLFGMASMVYDEEGKGSQYNSAVLFSSQGKQGRYDKIHRVPFGEYLPLRDWLPFLKFFVPFGEDYGVEAGRNLTRFALGNYHFGVLICNEDNDPFLARNYALLDEDGPPVDFLINISNDGWFDGTSEHDQHLAQSRFRAIESRRAMARAVNMGISAVIDGNGRILKPTAIQDGISAKYWTVVEEKGAIPSLEPSEWEAFKKSTGILIANIPIDNRFSFYAHAGDWFAGTCLAALGALLAYRLLRGVMLKKKTSTAIA